MRSLITHYVTVTLFFIVSITYITSPAHSQIVCDEFRLLTTIEGDKLVLSLVTDLPENTVVMVGVAAHQVNGFCISSFHSGTAISSSVLSGMSFPEGTTSGRDTSYS